jgi:predicted permease
MGTLLTILPIFIVVAIGYLLRKLGVVKNQWVSALNGFVYYVALPALIIKNISLLDWSSSETLKVVGWNIGLLIIASAVFVLLLAAFRIKKQYRAVIFLGAIVGNSVYLGFPLVSRMLGYQIGSNEFSIMSLAGVVQLVFGMVIALVVIEFLYSNTKDVKKIAKHISRNPLVIASFAGIVLSFVSFSGNIEQAINDTLLLLALTASPVALFALGAFLSGHKVKKDIPLIGLTVGLKLIALPLIAYILFENVIQAGETVRLSTILLASMPTAVTAFVLSESYKLDATFVAVTMLVSTILSLPLITIVLSLVK